MISDVEHVLYFAYFIFLTCLTVYLHVHSRDKMLHAIMLSSNGISCGISFIYEVLLYPLPQIFFTFFLLYVSINSIFNKKLVMNK